jgi:cation diffusion facilitator family transporter
MYARSEACSMNSSIPRAVYYALASNVAVAACKHMAATYTHSGSAFAEAVHSTADCMNQVFLLIGGHAAQTTPDEKHPFGFGRESHFYATLVALQIFLVGGVVSVAIGIYRLMNHVPLDHPSVVIAVLLASGMIEGIALKTSIATVERRKRPHESLWHWFLETRKPEMLLSIGEDAAALAGIAVSVIAIALSLVTGSPVFEALGAIAVGLILMAAAVLFVGKIKSMIVGESAHTRVREAMHKWLDERPEIEHMVSLIVLQWADDQLVAVQARLRECADTDELVRKINTLEHELKAAFPGARWIFFEPELEEHGAHPL